MPRQNISSNSPYEPIFGYSRAVKVGNQVFVSGSGAWRDYGELVGIGDMYAQARQTIRNMEEALAEAEAPVCANHVPVQRPGGRVWRQLEPQRRQQRIARPIRQRAETLRHSLEIDPQRWQALKISMSETAAANA